MSTAGAGVRGDADNGTGVFGGSNTSTAVGGISNSGIGVHGMSTSADGVFGNSETGRGVVGVAKAATGVEGNSTSGAGVFGSSQTGIGLHGKGGRLAGLFEGIVEVTGGLVVANVDVTSRIAALERELAALKTRISVLESQAGVPGGGGGVSGSASIGVELRLTGGAFNELRIFGSGFNANEPVALTHESVERFPDGRQGRSSSTFQTTADSQGRINHTMSVSCPAGFQTTHTARARGVSSGRLSNNAAASC